MRKTVYFLKKSRLPGVLPLQTYIARVFRGVTVFGFYPGNMPYWATLLRNLASEKANSTDPMIKSFKNGFHTTSIPAPRNRIA